MLRVGVMGHGFWLVVVVAALLIGALLGYLIARVRGGGRIEQLRVELEAARVRLEGLEGEAAFEGRLRSAFESLAGQTLHANSEMFLRMAREALGRDQVVAHASLKERETAISQLVEPLRIALERTEAQGQALER